MNSNSNSTPASRTAPRHVLLLLGAQVASLRDPPAGVHSSAKMRTNLSRLLTYARSVNPPPLIIHVRNTGDKGEPDEPGVPGWQLAFPPLPNEPVIDKLKNNAFANTNKRRDCDSRHADRLLHSCNLQCCFGKGQQNYLDQECSCNVRRNGA
jgi:hypothetical protein